MLSALGCSTLESIGSSIKKNPVAYGVLLQEGIYQAIKTESTRSKQLSFAKEMIGGINDVTVWYDSFIDKSQITPDRIDQYIAEKYTGTNIRPSRMAAINFAANEAKRIALENAGKGSIPADSVYSLSFLLKNIKIGASYHL